MISATTRVVTSSSVSYRSWGTTTTCSNTRGREGSSGRDFVRMLSTSGYSNLGPGLMPTGRPSSNYSTQTNFLVFSLVGTYVLRNRTIPRRTTVTSDVDKFLPTGPRRSSDG